MAMDFSILESVPDAMIITHRDGRILYVNSVAEELFGWDRADLLGQRVEVLLPARFRAIHEIHRGGYQAAPRTRPMGLGLDLYGLKKSGEEFSAEISLTTLRAGEDLYAVAAVRDVTERKKIEERSRLWRKAQEEVRERDEFLSIASHELRTPVTALQLQLQLLQRATDRAGRPSPEVLLQKMEVLDRQCRRIALLVNELLDVSRLRLGSLEINPEPTDLAELAREAARELQRDAARLGSPIEVAAEGAVRGSWDRVRIGQVITNLLSNAIKFGKGNPIRLGVSSADDRARLEIRDQGIGIDPADQERIFGRFERAVSAHHFGGLGLGLYISREVVAAHGGTIRLDSAPGVGSTFTIELPKMSPPLRSQPEPPRPQGPAVMRS
jgi:two-component system, LuxR family, sensor kinase FixL